jgi:hypothetical protein
MTELMGLDAIGGASATPYNMKLKYKVKQSYPLIDLGGL